jgi:hypothetical protein
MKGADFVTFRLAAGAGFSASSDPKTYSGRTHLNLLLSMTDLRVREIKRSTAAVHKISQHQPRAKRGPGSHFSPISWTSKRNVESRRRRKESCDGNRIFPSFPHYLFAVGNRASTRLISSVTVSIVSRKAISLASDGRPSNAASQRIGLAAQQHACYKVSISSGLRHSRHDIIIFALSSPSVFLSSRPGVWWRKLSRWFSRCRE